MQETPSIAPPPAHEPAHPRHSHHSHHHAHEGHAHTHGAIDPEIASSEQGIRAVKWSFVGLAITAAVQAAVFALSGSVALLADLIHNVGDALTAIPLGIAFLMSRWKPTPRFAYGYGRVEDLAGVAIVAIVCFSAIVTAYESIDRFWHPQPIDHLGALAIAAVVGFIGNETVARFRIRVGKAIGSAALVADGYHARADGLVSLGVLASAIGVGLRWSWADPLVGLLITLVLFRIVWESGQTIFTRLLDGVEPEVYEDVQHAVAHVAQVSAVNGVRCRWLGHRLAVEVAIAVDPALSVAEGAAIATQVQTQLQAHVPYLASAAVQLQPDREGTEND